MSNNTKLLCLFLKAQKKDKLSEQGYAMAVVSILSIVMLSLLAASMTFSNLAKSRTDAFVDSQSSFAVAESGLNKRAAELQAKLETYSGIAGISNPTKKVDSCFDDKFKIPTGKKQSTPTETDDFECRNYSFESSNNISKVAAAGGGISLDSNGQDTNKYLAYTFVADKTKYVGASPDSTPIPVGEPFAGLNAAEYKYVIQSVGRKPPVDLANSSVDKGGNNANLSMAFVTRVVPLFQFAIFYNGDLEFNSTSKMQVRGRVHSNANIYVQPAGIKNEEEDSVTDFLSIVTSAGSIYNRVDAWDQGIGRTGITRVLLTGKTGDCNTAGNCQEIPAYSASNTYPLTLAQINAFTGKELQDSAAGAVELKVPSPGFTRKRNYADNKIGLYYARADMRLEMVPDRDVTARTTATVWTRNKAIIPFNFTSVTTGSANCTSTLSASGSDPAADYIPSVREKFGTRQCNKFTKGQLQSLRQPVLVLTTSKQSTNALRDTESTTIEKPTGATPPVLNFSGTSVTGSVEDAKDKILRALQVALVSTPEPIIFDSLNKPFNISDYDSGNLNSFKTEFMRLVEPMFPVVNLASPSATDTANNQIRIALFAASPNQIAAIRDAWFLPAPIQRVEKLANTDSANPRSSGFYDGREKRWITMLQTNIASLSVWNRDGLYVKSSVDEEIRNPYASSTSDRNDAFNFGAGANFTDGMAFDRPAADATKPVGSLQYLGLGSSDRTEGGLIIHASVSDDLDGNGTMDGNDITVDKADANNRILKKKPNNDDYIDPKTGAVVVIDYHRKYPGQVTKTPFTPESPFAFAFNGGNYLPSALTLSSDQSIYIQGNFNNNASNSPPLPQPDTGVADSSADSLPASIIADTITALSNQCVDNGGTSTNGVPASQLKCGVNISAGSSPGSVTRSMAINAAFLSNTNLSDGNYPNGGNPLPALTARQYSGGVNNYIRLLEDWGNRYALNYSGSLISLGTPLEYSGEYVSGGGETATRTEPAYYNIPLRNFNYDPKFNKNENVPPLTPKASYVQQNGFNRAY